MDFKYLKKFFGSIGGGVFKMFKFLLMLLFGCKMVNLLSRGYWKFLFKDFVIIGIIFGFRKGRVFFVI